MNSNEKLVPELRFPKFENGVGWNKKKLMDIGEIVTGKTPDTQDMSLWGGDVLFITPTDIKDINKYQDDSERTIVKQKSTTLLPAGSIVYTCIASIGKIALTKKESVTNQQINSLIVNDLFINEFIFYALVYATPYIKSLTASSTIPIINKSEFSGICIPIPLDVEEQQKIASCLSSLDDLITGHIDKLKTLKEHKKGLMQDLFPKERKKKPKYRFPEFESDEEWIQVNLIDVVDKKVKWGFTGGPFGSNLKASDYDSNGIRIIQLQNIGDGEFKDDYKIYTSIEKADELLSCNIYSGDIILSKMGDPVGRACMIPEKLKRCLMASDGIRLVVDEKKHSKYFVYSLINSKTVRADIERKATGSTRKRIGLDELKQILLLIPKNINEQRKIAACLSALDDMIIEEAQMIEKLQLHKKGLTQGLFPNNAE
ncbi:restriction endonuclease subunit S [Mucilaginibacter flavus]|uniref:restriction endonuclease subunit S n=1 Tax=Mucilaginibacter flavus TaxID=931504 RepID=UPI0025B48DAE|nr:restriction endonuclease subunit S [Mucilaginibacter flavus]